MSIIATEAYSFNVALGELAIQLVHGGKRPDKWMYINAMINITYSSDSLGEYAEFDWSPVGALNRVTFVTETASGEESEGVVSKIRIRLPKDKKLVQEKGVQSAPTLSR